MMVPIESRILSAVLYADIFGYPLTIRELSQWIPSNKKISASAIQQHVRMLIRAKKIGYTPPFLYIAGHKKTIQLRIERLAASTAKWKRIRILVKILTTIPTICLVGVTGGLAVNNADNEDDIDLLIIAKHNTLWITRFISTILIELFSKRRHPLDMQVKNAVCLNMFLTDRSLQIAKTEQGWYTAHEVLQMVPLWDRHHMYTKYLRANMWTRQWFATRYDVQKQRQVPSYNTRNYHIKWYQIVERPMKRIQLWYMRKRRTSEIVSDTIIRFHPNDARIWIRKSFTAVLQRHKVPLDKNHNQI